MTAFKRKSKPSKEGELSTPKEEIEWVRLDSTEHYKEYLEYLEFHERNKEAMFDLLRIPAKYFGGSGV